jgi:hypothetical protein
MGICESEKNTPERNEVKEKTYAKKIDKPIESFQMDETSQVDKRINECIVQNKSEPFEKLDRKVMNVSKSICKLKIETISKTIIGTGFLLNFEIDQERFCCLMSNDHIIE